MPSQDEPTQILTHPNSVIHNVNLIFQSKVPISNLWRPNAIPLPNRSIPRSTARLQNRRRRRGREWMSSAVRVDELFWRIVRPNQLHCGWSLWRLWRVWPSIHSIYIHNTTRRHSSAFIIIITIINPNCVDIYFVCKCVCVFVCDLFIVIHPSKTKIVSVSFAWKS